MFVANMGVADGLVFPVADILFFANKLKVTCRILPRCHCKLVFGGEVRLVETGIYLFCRFDKVALRAYLVFLLVDKQPVQKQHLGTAFRFTEPEEVHFHHGQRSVVGRVPVNFYAPVAPTFKQTGPQFFSNPFTF